MTFRVAPLTAALLLACSAPVNAAPEPAPEPDPAARELDRVTVNGHRDGYGVRATGTATKTDTALQDIPQAVTVVTDEVMRDQGMTSLTDALRYVPGVSVAQGEGNRDTPILRGNSTTADLFVDGIRDDVQYIRDVYNISRVEVLKGPNAMIFGRGGAGGVVNRVTKVADGERHREVRLQTGSFERGRLTFDAGQALGGGHSVRVTGLYEDSGSFRDGFELRRYGINPTYTWESDATTVTLGYERFDDERVADRGFPSLRAIGIDRPVDAPPETFFGSPELSPVAARADAFTALVEHELADGILLRNRTRWADYEKFYQNVYPTGVVVTGGALEATLGAYNNATDRTNLFNQTDLIFKFDTGNLMHTLLAGAEFGRQETDNLRMTGAFTSPNRVPVSNPRYTGGVVFAPSATDANNHSVARVASAYVQDQIEFSPQWQAVIGARFDRFEVDLLNNRNGQRLTSEDDLWSPRVGLVWKPIEPLSVYASYSMTYLPRGGEQLSSLSASNRSLEPEELRNYEIGAKWTLRPGLMLSAAAYRLDRTNVVAPDPADPSRSILIDGQRNEGLELELAGELTDMWSVFAGYAYQEGATGRDLSSRGTRLGQLPRHSASLWNRFDLNPQWGLGLGVTYRDEIYAALPSAGPAPTRTVLDNYTRVDAALFYTVNENVQLQLNIENLLDEEYFISAHSNDNISPGSPRAAYLGVTLKF
ncbi:TonB-dependent receptor [Lysobacter humi (ex Lee et al. 2017)]